MAGGYAPSARFIKLLQNELTETIFLNVSFVGSHSSQKELAGTIENVIVTQAVLDVNAKLAIITDY